MSSDRITNLGTAGAASSAAGAQWLESIGIHTWADAAAAVSILWVCVMFGDWLWKKLGKPKE